MSPFSIEGTKPLYRCRSEPQIAVEVIRTIASRELRIFGSGTCSTRTFFLPSQQLALIALHSCYPYGKRPLAGGAAACTMIIASVLVTPGRWPFPVPLPWGDGLDEDDGK